MKQNIRNLRVWHFIVAAFVLASLYPISFGPACWLATRFDARKSPEAFRAFSRFYQPISIAIIRSPECVHDFSISYLELGIANDAEMYRNVDNTIFWGKPGYSYTVLSIPPIEP